MTWVFYLKEPEKSQLNPKASRRKEMKVSEQKLINRKQKSNKENQWCPKTGFVRRLIELGNCSETD